MSELPSAFVAGAVAGLAVAIPFGPIAILIVETALRRGWTVGVAAGLGAATIDGLYALIAVFAGALLAGVIAPVAVPLRIVSAGVLIAIALRSLLALRRGLGAGERPLGGSRRRTYLTVLGLTAINPTTLIYFSALVLGLPAIGGSAPTRISFAAGAILASAAWQTLIASVGALLHRRLPDRARLWTGVVGDLIVLALAANILRSAIDGGGP